MSRSIAIRRLCWKELRQMWPLTTFVLVMGIAVYLLALLSLRDEPQVNWDGFQGLCAGMPVLFAFGLGALIVLHLGFALSFFGQSCELKSKANSER